MLNADELAGMRATVNGNMPDTCAISTPASAGQNDDGSPADGSPTVRSGIPCRVAPLRLPEEQVFAARLQGSQGYSVALPWGTALTDRDRIAWQGVTFEVIGVQESSYATSVRAVCRRIE